MAALTAPAAVPPKAGIDRGLRYAVLAATVAALGILAYGTVATTRPGPTRSRSASSSPTKR